MDLLKYRASDDIFAFMFENEGRALRSIISREDVKKGDFARRLFYEPRPYIEAVKEDMISRGQYPLVDAVSEPKIRAFFPMVSESVLFRDGYTSLYDILPQDFLNQVNLRTCIEIAVGDINTVMGLRGLSGGGITSAWHDLLLMNFGLVNSAYSSWIEMRKSIYDSEIEKSDFAAGSAFMLSIARNSLQTSRR
jgi:hypothetical protein